MRNLKVLKSYTLFSFLLMSLCILVGGEVSAQCNWKVAAAEGQGLNFVSNTAMVRYGTPHNFVEKEVSNGMGCTNVTFGDPCVGFHKLCWVCEEDMPSGSCWTIVASEHRVLSLSGTQTVRYGTATQYVEKRVTNGQKCNSATFGEDPAPGKRKQCSVCSGGGS